MSTPKMATVQGYYIKGTLYLNADELELAFLRFGEKRAAEYVEDIKGKIKVNIRGR